MSGLAITRVGEEPKDAWEYHNIYKLFGISYSNFFCPYCGLELIDKCIYKDEGEYVAKSPHFATKKCETHDNDCPENTKYNKENIDKLKTYYAKRGIRFPEKFIDPPNRENIQKSGVLSDSIDNIKMAIRQNASALKKRGPITPRTFLCQSLAIVWESILHEGYELQKEKKWDKNKFNEWIKKGLSSIPLVLLGEENKYSNYRYAFTSPVYPNFSFYKVYHFEGTVDEVNDFYIIRSALISKISNNSNREKPFKVTICKKTILDNRNLYSHIIEDLLSNSCSNNKPIKCYAIGKPVESNGIIVLDIKNTNRLYIKYLNK